MSFIQTTSKDVKFCLTSPENTTLEIQSKIKCSCIFVTWPFCNSKSTTSCHQLKCGVYLRHVVDGHDKILLVQSRGKLWGFPKGDVKKNETMKEAACREVKEETSLDISLNNEPVYRMFNTFVFVKEIKHVVINLDDITKISDNDCSGVAMVEQSCLKHKRHNINLNMLTTTVVNSGIH